MDSESDSITSDDGGGKKEEMKKSIFIKRKSNESTEANAKDTAIKNPFTLQQNKKAEEKSNKSNMNINKAPVVSLTINLGSKRYIILWTNMAFNLSLT